MLPLMALAQSMTDSTNVINPSNQAIIRFTTSYQSMSYVNGDSIRFRGTTTKRLGLVSPLDLPINSATTTALNAKQGTITTGTTAQYFRGDLSLATFPTTTAPFSNSTNKNFVTDAQATVIGNTSGTNTGDNATNSQYSGLAASKVNVSDTASMLTNYARNSSVVAKVNISDTASMLTNYTRNSTTILKLNISDTANMVSGYLRKTGSAATLTSIPVNQATGVLPFANGGRAGSAATSATTGTISVSMTTSVITCTPSGNMTLNATGGVVGQITTFSFTTSGTTSFTITFGTNFRKTGTLATGVTSARFFTVSFICLDGTIWTEIARTIVQT